MKVVVTGASSFIGAAVVGRLLEAGHEVEAVIRPGSSHLEQLKQAAERGGRDRLNVRPLALERIGELAGLRADGWIHLGWEGAGSHNRTLRSVQQENVLFGLEAVRTASKLGCGRFLFTGSQAEYGIWHQTVDESTPCRPVSEYGKAKADFCRQAAALCRELGMEYVHGRIYSVYGPGDHPWSLVSSCLQTWNRGGVMKLGECSQKWNFLYIEDTAAALACLLTEGASGVYNIASTDTRPLRSYVEEMYELCGRRGSFLYGERPQNAEGAADLMPDTGKIRRETSWRPQTTFAEGIYGTLHSLRGASAGSLPV